MGSWEKEKRGKEVDSGREEELLQIRGNKEMYIRREILYVIGSVPLVGAYYV